MKFVLTFFSLLLIKAIAAQSYTGTHTPSVQVNKITDITVTSTNSVNVASSVDYLTGTTYSNFWTVQVYANSTWFVTVNAQTANFSPTTVNTVPVSILSFRKNGDLNWTTLSTTATQVSSGSKGDNTVAGNSFGVDLRVIPTLNYEPGFYTLNIIFTSTVQ